MNTYISTTLVAVLLSLSLAARDYTKEVIDLWPANNIPYNKVNHSFAETADSTGRRISQISVPKLYVYRKTAPSDIGAAIMYIPGGGYSVVSLSDEGEAYAKQFLKMGFDVVAVLKYRLPDERIVTEEHKVPLCDAQKALSTIHKNASTWNISRDKIAVMGGSAGGHLAASLANLTKPIVAPGVTKDELEQAVSILLYPVISFNLPHRHKGSFRYLLGENSKNTAMLDYYSMEKRVNKNTPPTYLVHAIDDLSVPYQNSDIYAESLDQKGISHKCVHLDKGGHGFGLNFERTGLDWTSDLEQWLNTTTTIFSTNQ
ncbi:alpha/beta hydrolase [Mangrovibacterium sp.]|uniref:alpha/beta hydrolase n=1 Tax=Mangrovibacterium sp. TaxID=1961364 RepID=UPI00356766A6